MVWTSPPLDQPSARQPLLPMADAATIAELESTVASLQATVTSLVHSLSNVTAAANTSRIDAAEEMRNLKGSIDTFYLLYSGTLVFFMQARVPGDRWRVPRHTSTADAALVSWQAGFGVLEAGSVRIKNTRNILLKNLLDACAAHPATRPATAAPRRCAHRHHPALARAQVRGGLHLVGVGARHRVPSRHPRL